MIKNRKKHRENLVSLSALGIFLVALTLQADENPNRKPKNYFQKNTEIENNIPKKHTKLAKNNQDLTQDHCSVTPASKKILILTNDIRSKSGRCGRKKYKSTAKLIPSCKLSMMAKQHAEDMWQHGNLSHRSSDGADVKERARRTGVGWRALGENIAAGYQTAEAVHQSWVDSPRHCANMVNKEYTHIGIARQGDYWVTVFAAY